MPFAAHILSHLEDALTECFEYHSQLDSFVRRVGLSQSRLDVARQRAEDRKGRWSSAPKRYVAQEILEETRTGTSDDDRLVASIIEGFCRGTFSGAKPLGLNAVEELKKGRDDDSRAAAEKRLARQREIEEAQQKNDQAGAAKTLARDAFKQRFLVMSTMSDAQQRGYALETFLNDFMEHEGLSPRALLIPTALCTDPFCQTYPAENPHDGRGRKRSTHGAVGIRLLANR